MLPEVFMLRSSSALRSFRARPLALSFSAMLAIPLLLNCAGADPSEPDVGEPDVGEPDVDAPCEYPENDGTFRVGQVLPIVEYPGAYAGDGTTFDFSLKSFHCDAEYERYTSLMILFTAEWCTACPQYVKMVEGLFPQLDAAGVKIVSYVAQDRSGELETNEAAHAYTSGYIGEMDWVRVGSATEIPARAIHDAPIWTATPNVFVVRKSDMMFASSQEDTQYILPLVRIANSIDEDWTNPDTPPFTSLCTDDTEEAGEPNDVPGDATPLLLSTPIDGGICSSEPDFYTVDFEGTWKLDLLFANASGDLDVYVALPDGRPLGEDGVNPSSQSNAPIGSESVTDNESFTYTGPALIRVHGYQGASAPYTISLSEDIEQGTPESTE
ncbi:MAG: hypothetical protein GY822_18565 [Deltaproteobacteria bacterium]|nr:hypothetical protein [Deltaproteobacteria bacterium]